MGRKKTLIAVGGRKRASFSRRGNRIRGGGEKQREEKARVRGTLFPPETEKRQFISSPCTELEERETGLELSPWLCRGW